MDISKKPWPIATTFGIKSRINTNPDFQRPAVWGVSQKQLLIDSILRDYDVPKFYWRKVGSKPDQYEVVDGQQRLRAIWEFQSGGYCLAKDSEPLGEFPIKGLYYAELPDELRSHFDVYPLDVVVLTETDEDEVRDMFLRLQNGTTLKAQEKRNAMPGNMRQFIKELSNHEFFQSLNFKNSRYAHDHVAAQMTLIELEGGPCNVKNTNLMSMYETNCEFDTNGLKAKKIRKVLDYLRKAFPTKTPELERFNVISLYVMVSYLLEQHVITSLHADLANWFIEFEKLRRDQDELPDGKGDPEFVSYKEKISHSTDSKDSIHARHEFLIEKFFLACPNIEQKDDQRLFSYEQRLAIFRRDSGSCKVKLKCKGEKCEWDKWQADHIKPWSKGGKTTVANGQVACLVCNLTKSNK